MTGGSNERRRRTLGRPGARAADQTHVTSDTRAALFPERAAQAAEYLKELGALTTIDLVGRMESEGKRIYRYRAA